MTVTLEDLSKTFQRSGMVVDSIHMEVGDGEFFTLLGPSGCGKTTILRMIAGFEEPSGGRILFNGKDVTHLPPNRRGIGLVFQNYALFPHLSVAKNVAFGLEVRKLPASEIDARVATALDQVQLRELGNARVDQLSGGQQQRVALARALVIRPAVLLLDEPLSNLDAKLREETRAMLRALHLSDSRTTIYVTHDQSEALGMSDRIAVLNKGRVHQVARPEDLYRRPATRFVASFIGHCNVLDAVVEKISDQSAVLRFGNGGRMVVDADHRAPGVVLSSSARVGVCVRAESLQLTGGPGVFSGEVTDVEYTGPSRTCIVQTDLGALRVEVPSSAGRLSRGEQVRIDVIPEAVHMVGAE
jgi:iron(III) transport system ATP-binding protein